MAKPYRCGTNREIYSMAGSCVSPEHKKMLHQERPSSFPIGWKPSSIISGFVILVSSSILPSSFGTVALLWYAKGNLPSSNPIKSCSGKPVWIQQDICTTSFVVHWPVNFCVTFTPLLCLNQTALEPQRMAEFDSDSVQLSTNNKLSRWVHKAHNDIPDSRKLYIYFFLCQQH